MKLALVRQRYTPYGGAERFVERALSALSDTGVQITVIARDWQGSPGHRLVRCDPPYLGRLLRDAGFARCVCREVARSDFALVQSHERIACCDVYRAGDGLHRDWLAARARVLSPLARLFQRLSPYHRYVLAQEARLFQSPRLKAVICNSRMVRDAILHHFCIDAHKLHVIYNGVDTRHFHPRCREVGRALRQRLAAAEDTPVFAFVGSGFLRKGLDAALAALARMPAPAVLLVVGGDRHLPRYRRRAERLGLGARVIFAGPQKDVLPYYGAADALLLPTLYDPFPNVVLEAAACGLPVITSRQCGAAEILAEGETGFVHDALDVDGLAQSLQLLAHSDRARSMGEAARALAERFSLERMATDMVNLYRRLLSESREQLE